MFHKTQTKDFTSLVTEAQTQQGFIDEHTSIADPSRSVDDDQDDEMPEPIQKSERWTKQQQTYGHFYP